MNRTLAAALAVLGALTLAAPAHASRASDALKRELGPGVRVAAHGSTGQVRFVGTAAGRPIPRPAGVSATAPPREAARAFLARHRTAFGLRAADALQVTASKAGLAGRSAVRFQQLHAGVPVVGGELVVNLDRARNVLSVSGETLPAAVDTSPRVGSAAARAAAVAAVAKEHGVNGVRLTATLPSLAIYDAGILGGPGPERASLVWRLEVKGGDGMPIDELVLVDAVLGHVAVSIDQIEEALTRRICDANNTETQVPCTAGLAVASETDPPATGDHADVFEAFEFSGDTYDLFAGLGRDSLDDAGMPLINTVRFCDLPSPCPYQNAFWDGAQMVYGEGFTADDVVGHELTHGVTDFSAHLFYYYQSGAINESLSDVFGEFVDLTNGADAPADRWKLAEDIAGGPIRNMQDPTVHGDPDRMTAPQYTADPNELDRGGVHTNSGVNNKAAYLMTDGGAFNGQTVGALGIPKVSRIYYEVQTNMLTSAGDYADLAAALPQACTNLIGTAGITSADCTQVGRAVAAVEMATPPPAAPNPEAPVCATGLVPTNLLADDMENTASGNWAAQGEWYYPQTANPYGFDATYATSGSTNLWGYARGAAGTHAISMARSVTLPAGTAYLRFKHAYGFEDGASAFDGGVLEYSTNGGATYVDAAPLITENGYNGTLYSGSPLAGRAAFTRESNGYISTRATLTDIGGESVRFRFRIATDSTVDDLGWFIDDLAIYTCAPPAPPDADGDGVPDASDACPSVAASTPNGCPDAPGPTGPTGPTGPGGPAPTNPTGPGGGEPATTLASARVRSCKLAGRGRKARLRCTLRRFGAVRRATVTVKKGRKTVARKTVRPSSRGVLSIKPRRTLRRGRYKVTLVLRDARGAKRTLKKTLRVR